MSKVAAMLFSKSRHTIVMRVSTPCRQFMGSLALLGSRVGRDCNAHPSRGASWASIASALSQWSTCMCTEVIVGRAAGAASKHFSHNVLQSSINGHIAGHSMLSNLLLPLLSIAPSSLACVSKMSGGCLPVTTKWAIKPKTNTSALGFGEPFGWMSVSGAFQPSVPPNGLGLVPSTRERPKSKSFACGSRRPSSTSTLLGFKSP
mmetsp:Transcript_42042/g.96552  ORF Transcript_42042/g.96552 Transcript_42042/m.96552 type:complete len:204 (-) Transcript_42042:148-759(-)